MLRQLISQTARPALRSTILTQQRTFAISAIRMGEGDTGGTRSGGAASDDAFSKRERASEDFYVKEQERNKLKELREKLQQQQKHLAELDKHLEEIGKASGGEKN